MIPINLNTLRIADAFKGQSLSENRIYLDDLVFDVKTDFVGLVSARYNERVRTNFPRVSELEAVAAQMHYKELFAPSSQRVDSKIAYELWIKKQDGEHPGIAQVLERLDTGLNWPTLGHHGFAVLGNQFIVHRDVWFDLVNFWRTGFFSSYKIWGMNAPFSHRCFHCGANKPDGYSRYGPQRHAGFLGERITAMYFAQRGLELSDLCKPDPVVNHALLNILSGKSLGYLWQMSRFPNRFQCEVCAV